VKTSSDAGVVEGLAIARMFGRVLRHPAHQLQELAAKEGSDSVAPAVVLGEDVDPLDLIGGTKRIQEALLPPLGRQVAATRNSQVRPCAPEERVGSAETLKQFDQS
jgi:hypothetical protein